MINTGNLKKNEGCAEEKEAAGEPWGTPDMLLCLLAAAAAVMLIWLITPEQAAFGSKTDWLSQHSVLPDYFRQSFYRSGVFFPEFAIELGGGQNIYNFSYYGLFNPIILVSYLLPSVEMRDYLAAASAVEAVFCAVLFFVWIRGKKISRRAGLLTTLCFLCASPLLFHLHRQIMFVNYMPFLLTALIAMDRSNEKRRHYILFCISVLCCILTSYFFSVGCLAALLLYGVSELGGEDSRQICREKRKRFLGCGVLAVMLAAFLWVPTGLALLSGREASGAEGGVGMAGIFSAMRLFLPKAEPQWLLGGAYTLGLTWIAPVALLTGLAVSRGRKRTLPAVLLLLLLVPGLTWLLCGTLYTRPKALIPFLPLYCLLIGRFVAGLENWQRGRAGMAGGQVGEKRHEGNRAAVGGWLRMAMGGWFRMAAGSRNRMAARRAVYALLAGAIAAASLLQCLEANSTENWADRSGERLHTTAKEKLLRQRETGDLFRTDDFTYVTSTVNQTYSGAALRTSVYSSLFNQGYARFCTDIMETARPARNRMISASTENLFFQTFMGVRYMLSKQVAPAGYERLAETDGISLYENSNVLPLGWAASRTTTLKELEAQELQSRLQTLFESIAVEETVQNSTTAALSAESLMSVKPRLPEEALSPERPWFHKLSETEQRELFSGQDLTEVCVGKTVCLPLKKSLQGKILLIEFDVTDKGSDQDIAITINGITNKLSKKTAPYPNENTHFVYVISSAGPLRELKVQFGKGAYDISPPDLYIMEAQRLWKAVGELDRFQADEECSRENRIEGSIHITKDGWFASTIPYDKGFEIKVDGEAQEYFRVNGAFIGFPITAGEHRIEMVYHAPGKGTGIAVTVSGAAIGTLIFFKRRRKGSVSQTGLNVKLRTGWRVRTVCAILKITDGFGAGRNF